MSVKVTSAMIRCAPSGLERRGTIRSNMISEQTKRLVDLDRRYQFVAVRGRNSESRTTGTVAIAAKMLPLATASAIVYKGGDVFASA